MATLRILLSESGLPEPGESRRVKDLFLLPEVEVVLRASTFPANTLHICKRDQESSSYLWTPDCS